MLVLKLMSGENKADCNSSKGFQLVCCDNVYFYRRSGIAVADVYIGDDTTTYFLDGNAYVMQNGKTIASFSFVDFGDMPQDLGKGASKGDKIR